MEVTRENFEAALPCVRDAVAACDFMAIDLEMSGLFAREEDRPRATDTMQKRWEIIRDAGMEIAVLQVGVCAFTWEPPPGSPPREEGKAAAPTKDWTLKAEPFNFWVFPQHVPGLTRDARLVMQVSSISFLSSCSFDFNKAFNHGIPYVDSAAAARARDTLEARIAEKLEESKSPSAASSSSSIKIGDFRDATMRAAMQTALATATSFHTAVSRDGDVSEFARDAQGKPFIVLEKCNGFCRRFLYQEMTRLFPQLHVGKFAEDNVGNTRAESLRLTFSGSASSAAATERERLEKTMEKDRQTLETNVGFSRVIDCIRDAKKPVVGHNCFLDMAHVYAKFVGPPPLPIDEYRAALHAAFPKLVDTKFVFQRHSLLSNLVSNTALGDAYSLTAAPGPFQATNPTVQLEKSFSSYQDGNESLHHEAGFDAFMTGVIFGRAWAAMGLAVDVDFASQPEFNEICLASTDGRFRLDQPVEEVDFSNFVRLCNFDPSVKSHHLQKIIKDTLGSSYVRVVWESDTSAVYKAASVSARNALVNANAAARVKRRSEASKAKNAAFGMADLEIVPFTTDSAPQKRARTPGSDAENDSSEAKRACVAPASADGPISCNIA